MNEAGSGNRQLRVVQPRALLREQVFDMLRNAIVEGHYAPGSRLIERELCEALGVSRTSVREALRQLESEQLVHVEPRRGPVVAAITRREAQDIYEARAAFETAVVKLFIERAPETAFRELRGAADLFARAVEKSDLHGMLDSMSRFYGILLRGAANTVMESVTHQLMARVAYLRGRSLSEPGRLRFSLAEIEELTSAVIARDIVRAQKAAAHHIEQARDSAIRQLARDHEPDGKTGTG